MEIKAELKYPYSDNERMDFIVVQNHRLGYEIRKIEREIEEIIIDPETGEPVTDAEIVTRTVIDLEAWGFTVEEKEQQERERINCLSLTKREVFLAIYRDKQITPEMIRSMLTTEEAKIEFDFANDYFRGNPLISQLGEALGYTPYQLDKLFETGEIPPDVNKSSEGGASDTSENAPSGNTESEG